MQVSTISFVLVIVFAWISHFLVDLMIGIWPVYKTLAQLDLAIAGLIGALCALGGESLQIFFGTLCDRGYRKVLILGGLVITTTSVCFIYTNSYLSLFFLYLLTCIGSGAFHPSAVSLVSDLPTQKKGILVTLFTSGGAFGMAFSQMIFTQTYSWLDGQVIWLALPTLILALLMAFSSLLRSTSSQAKAHADFNIKAVLSFFRIRELRLLYFSQVCGATMLWGTMFLLPDFLSSRGNEPWVAFGGGHLVFILGSAFMMIPAGYLADRYSSRTVLLWAMAVGMFFFYTLLFFPLLSSSATLALLFCLGASLGVINPVAVALGTSLVPQQKGMVSAFLMGLVWCISEGIGQGGGGILASLFVDDAPAKALAILGVSFLVGFATTFQLPEKNTALELA